MPQSQVVELVQVVRVRVDREAVARILGRPSAAIVEVEPLLGAVHLQHGARLGRLAVERVPVEVEVVADADLAPGRVGDDVHVGAAQRRP